MNRILYEQALKFKLSLHSMIFISKSKAFVQ